MFGEGEIELGEDFGGGFDGEEGKAFHVTDFKTDPRIEGT